MADTIRPVPDTADDNRPKTVATPEGDNEYAPDQPLVGYDEALDGLQNPRGAEPDDEYKKDKN